MENKDMEKFVMSFLKQNNLNVNVEITNKDKNIASYNSRINTLAFNPDKISQENARKYNISIENYLLLILSHELGHYCDKDRVELLNRTQVLSCEINKGNYTVEIENELLSINKILERNAYRLGKKYVPTHLNDEYELLNEKNMEVTSLNQLRLIYELKNEAEQYELKNKINELIEENERLRDENIDFKQTEVNRILDTFRDINTR
ncbi:hypothetical protein NSA56_01915 [Oceanobacillus caeni]|uniref:hypothetical protein n=1 Tax=Oceanobacillus caeni TaxID=405946 RepID=UPI00214A459C|nr:hypothetical protein [Oceanobacillus caeni]MCR1833153.1 hypothetical protein [Oceanobacillus caeni]